MADQLKNANARTGFSGLSAIPDEPPPSRLPPNPKAAASASSESSGARNSPSPRTQPAPPPLGTYQSPIESGLAKFAGVILQRVRRVFDRLLVIAFNILVILGVAIGLTVGVIDWRDKPQTVPPPAAEQQAPQRAAPLGIMGAGGARNTDLQSTPAESRSLPQSNSPNDGVDGATYRVPQDRLAEVDASKNAADAALRQALAFDGVVERQKRLLKDAKAKVDQFQNLVNEFGERLNEQRPLVNTSDQSQINSFNALIAKYKADRTLLHSEINDYNGLVDEYNGIVGRAQQLNHRASHLMEIYNSKLEQYGTPQ